jgi:hypothetical protein
VAIWDGDEFRLFRDRLTRGEPDPLCVGCVKRFEW